VDHINRNGLDNCKINLRLVNQKIQSINHGCQVNNNSGVTGVSYYKNSGVGLLNGMTQMVISAVNVIVQKNMATLKPRPWLSSIARE